MIAKAHRKYLQTSPQKVRLVVDQIRGKRVEDALSILRFSPKMVARDLEKLLKSAVANAEQREERVDVDRLLVSRAFVDEGPTLNRARFRAMGRIFRINKRSSHVTFELDLKGRGGKPLVETVDDAKPARKTRAKRTTTKKAPVKKKKKTTARKSAAGGAKKKAKKKTTKAPARKAASGKKKATKKKTGGKKS